jgi:hypothetical protein
MTFSFQRGSLTTLSRPVDLRVSTNRAIAGGSVLGLLAGSVTGWIQGLEWSEAVLLGLAWAGAIFLSWALGRETDPDHPSTAFVAAASGLAGSVFLGPPAFLPALWILLSARMIVRSTGAEPGVLDIAGLTALCMWLGISVHWSVPVLTLPPIWSAGISRVPFGYRLPLLLAFPAASAWLVGTQGVSWRAAEMGAPHLLGAIVLALMQLPVVASYGCVTSIGDRDDRPLRPIRVRSALAWTAAVLLALNVLGVGSVRLLLPVWAALSGTSLRWIVQRVWQGAVSA